MNPPRIFFKALPKYHKKINLFHKQNGKFLKQ